MVSGSDDRTVRVWDAATGALAADPFTGHTDWVRSVAVGQLDGRTIVVSGSSDWTVRVWDADGGAITDKLPRRGEAEITPRKIDLAGPVLEQLKTPGPVDA